MLYLLPQLDVLPHRYLRVAVVLQDGHIGVLVEVRKIQVLLHAELDQLVVFVERTEALETGSPLLSLRLC